MKDYRVFLIDLDGTVYRGKETVESGVILFNRLFQSSKDYFYLKKNTKKTPQKKKKKIKKEC